VQIPKGTATQLAVNEAFFIHILSHPNILRHKETIVCDERKINLVTEYCELGDVQTLVDMQLSFSEVTSSLQRTPIYP
jgi:serine/threonine protein kinase